MPEGNVYILINDAMPGYVKIGMTEGPVSKRMKELDSAGVPLPFGCFYAARVADVNFVEKQLHDAFGDQRVRSRREFFQIDPARVAAALKLAELEDVTPREDIVETSDDQRALDTARTKSGSFNMAMVGIAPDTELIFSRDESITCKVLDKHEVEFEGERMSLTASALRVMKRIGYSSNSIAGPQYWMFESETLYQRKKRLEEE